jgi:hypothetical protein
MDFANLSQFNFGELLVQMVFTRLSGKSIPYFEWNNEHKKWDYHKSDNLLKNYTFVTDRPLLTGSDEQLYSSNGMYRIDVVAHNNEKAIPIEVKLGNTGGAKSFPKSFAKKWKDGDYLKKKNPGNSKNTDNIKTEDDSDYVFTGNMIQILDSDRRFLEDQKSKDRIRFWVQIKSHNNMELDFNDGWWLVLRSSCLPNNCKQINMGNNKNSFKRLKKIFVFEDLWINLEPKDRKEIRKMLIEMINAEFNNLNNSLGINNEDLLKLVNWSKFFD